MQPSVRDGLTMDNSSADPLAQARRLEAENTRLREENRILRERSLYTQHSAKLHGLRATVLTGKARQHEIHLHVLRQSTCWRITAPLRLVGS